MTWQDCLDLGPTRLSKLLGCSKTTASNWILRSKKGDLKPAKWQQRIYLKEIKEGIKEGR